MYIIVACYIIEKFNVEEKGSSPSSRVHLVWFHINGLRREVVVSLLIRMKSALATLQLWSNSDEVQQQPHCSLAV